MSDHPLEQLNSQVFGSDSTNSTVCMKKRRYREFLEIPESMDVNPMTPNQVTRPSSIISQVNNDPPSDNQLVVSHPVTQEANLQSSLQSSPSNKAQVAMDIFPSNIPYPVIKTELPRLQERIMSTAQLVYCISLLPQDSLSPAAVPGDDAASDGALCLQEPTLNKAELDWLEEIKKNPMEQDYLRWLLAQMVEVFVADTTKDSVELAEIVALGPVLQKELYRKLLSSLIKDFDDARILDVNLLQGLVKLVQSASTDYLISDDLVRILSIIRARLEGTHRQSIEHTYQLTLAVSKVLDVMADHKVQDLDRVLQHEPLSGVLSGLESSSDPYVMYQACYAFQALQYVPDGESALQAVLRHSTGVVDGLVKVSAVFKLGLASVLEGLGRLQESVGSIVGVATTVYEGVSSLMESGQGVFDSLKEGLSTGRKRPWYPAIKAAYAFAEAGQLNDLRQLIFEAPCHHDPLFQWGICQLLGEIAVNPAWAVATRQQSISLLGHLFKNDREWGRDESVKAWMLSIITKLGSTSDQGVNTIALALLQYPKQDQCTSILHPYPLTTRLSIPFSSPVLAKVHNIPSVEYDLHKLRQDRLKEAHLPVYIPPMAKANLKARDDDHFPLMDKVQEFLASDRQVMLILGDSGSGKSTFNTHLELVLLQSYTRGGRIPLFINLPVIREPEEDMVAKQLRYYNFTEDQVQELKHHRQFILICDGYDESQLPANSNLHTSNFFNRSNQWDVKLVISCRSQYLGQDYHDRFIPKGSNHYNRSTLDLFQEAAITPFSRQQIQDYVEQYVPLEPRTWTSQDYLDNLTNIPNLMDLVKNPFLLSLSLEALPKVTEGNIDLSSIKITRVKLYDTFVEHWLDVNKRRLQGNVLSKEDRAALDDILDTGFVSMGVDYSTRLASAIFEQQEGNPVVQYIPGRDKHSWKAKFFGSDPDIRLLRESSPLTRTGSLFRFLHRSMLEYFLSCAIFDPSGHVDSQEFPPRPDPKSSLAQPPDLRGPLFMRSLLAEPSIIQFLCERVKQHSNFKTQLLTVIEQSKTDSSAAIAAANAITILVRAGVRFNGADFRGIRIPGADLSGSQLDSAQLQGADLRGVTIAGSWLRLADLSGAQMAGVQFGELPFLDVDIFVTVCAYSPDGKMLAVGKGYGDISIYDTTTWIRAYLVQSIAAQEDTTITSIAFSPDSQQIVYGKDDGTVQLWKLANKDTVLNLEGHYESVKSVAFSPCSRQLASASEDMTVRLWSSETGECEFILEGHAEGVGGVAYCADGKNLVSGSSNDGTIRVWDSKIGEMIACWNIAHEEDSALAFSADGQWVAVALVDKIQITNAVTGESGLVLNNKGQCSCIAFSSNGQWIVTSSIDDKTLRLWDLASGLLISNFSGHTNSILTCTFSPSCSQIASGDENIYVRLWEVDMSRAITDLDRPTSRVSTVTYSPDGRSILSCSEGQGLQKWDSQTGEPTPLPFKMPDDVLSYSLSPDGNQIATGHKYGTIRLWNRQADAADCTLLGHTKSVIQLTYSTCGRWIVSTSQGEARLWDLQTNEHPGIIAEGDICAIWFGFCIALTPTGQIALSLGRGGLRLHDLHTQDPCTALKEIYTDLGISALDYSPGGQEFATGSDNGSVYLWDFQSDKPRIELQGYGGVVYSIAYSPCGKWIISGIGRRVQIWRFRTGEISSWSHVADVDGYSQAISRVAWNPKVALEFVTGCLDGSVRVWRIVSHVDDDEGDVTVQMLCGNDVGLLCVWKLTFESVIGLSSINRELLVQRGAFDDLLASEGEGDGAE